MEMGIGQLLHLEQQGLTLLKKLWGVKTPFKLWTIKYHSLVGMKFNKLNFWV